MPYKPKPCAKCAERRAAIAKAARKIVNKIKPKAKK